MAKEKNETARIIHGKSTKPKVFAIERSERFSGPIPPPSIMKGYEEICPGAANRIIRMSENQLSHRHTIEKTIINSNVKNERLGMHYAFVLTFILVSLGFYLISNNKDIPAYFLIFGPAVFHAGNYIYSKRNEFEKLREKDKQIDNVDKK